MRLGSITDENLVAGDEQSRRAAREERRREDRLRIAMKAGWPELNRKDIKFGRFFLEHLPTGELFRKTHGEVYYGGANDHVAAYYIDPAGDVVLLERPDGTQTRDELEERRAAKEARPKRRPPRGVA